MEWAPLIWGARDPRMMMAGETKQHQVAPTGPLLGKRANGGCCGLPRMRRRALDRLIAWAVGLSSARWSPRGRTTSCTALGLPRYLIGLPLVAAWPSKASTPSPIGARAVLPERMGRLPPTAP